MNSSEPRQLNSAQKAGFISLLVFALVTISFSFLQLRNTVYGRFIIRQETTSLNTAVYDENTRLQQIDTDQDGLNDYEELYLYSTSPYLADTDSDGLDDAAELFTTLTDPVNPDSDFDSVLDGDELRSTISRDLGFTEEDRMEQNRRAANMARILNEQGIHVMAALISPTHEIQTMIKHVIGINRCFLIRI